MFHEGYAIASGVNKDSIVHFSVSFSPSAASFGLAVKRKRLISMNSCDKKVVHQGDMSGRMKRYLMHTILCTYVCVHTYVCTVSPSASIIYHLYMYVLDTCLPDKIIVPSKLLLTVCSKWRFSIEAGRQVQKDVMKWKTLVLML